jgi:hypothetical protein
MAPDQVDQLLASRSTRSGQVSWASWAIRPAASGRPSAAASSSYELYLRSLTSTTSERGGGDELDLDIQAAEVAVPAG